MNSHTYTLKGLTFFGKVCWQVTKIGGQTEKEINADCFMFINIMQFLVLCKTPKTLLLKSLIELCDTAYRDFNTILKLPLPGI